MGWLHVPAERGRQDEDERGDRCEPERKGGVSGHVDVSMNGADSPWADEFECSGSIEGIWLPVDETGHWPDPRVPSMAKSY